MTLLFLRKNLFWLLILLLLSCSVTEKKAEHQHELDMSQIESLTFSENAKNEVFRCPMHPHTVQDHPGNCPICGMDLEKVERVKATTAKGSLQERAAVKISSTRQQLIGVKTTQIKRRANHYKIRTVARLAHNEQRLSHVHTKYEGWLEKVYANFKGKYVKKGEALVDIYSPELVAAQKELLVALKSSEQFKESLFTESQKTVEALVDAAEEKLRLYDMTPTQIMHLRNSGQVKRTLTLYAPKSGYITELKAVHGMRVTAGTPLYTLASLADIWVQARVYENELADVRVGQEALVTLPFYPDLTYSGHVSYIDPSLDPKTRTANVRVVLPNTDGTLKPEMFANLEIIVRKTKRRLTIPAAAVIRTGLKNIAFEAKKDGLFDPKEIKLGKRLGDDFELLGGLKSGAIVVTEAQFLVDSESQMQAVVSQMQTGQ